MALDHVVVPEPSWCLLDRADRKGDSRLGRRRLRRVLGPRCRAVGRRSRRLRTARTRWTQTPDQPDGPGSTPPSTTSY